MDKLDMLMPELKNKDIDYVNSIRKKYNDFILYAELPYLCQTSSIDVNNLPYRLYRLYSNIVEVVDDHYSVGINVINYFRTGKYISALLDNYFVSCVKQDKQLNSIIYVDTNLLIDDYKKLMDTSKEGISPSLTYSLETLYTNIDTATMVVWDRFSLISTAFEKQKLYNILLSRYRKGLGNIFIMKDCVELSGNLIDDEMSNVMNLDVVLDCRNENVKLLDVGEKGQISW